MGQPFHVRSGKLGTPSGPLRTSIRDTLAGRETSTSTQLGDLAQDMQEPEPSEREGKQAASLRRRDSPCPRQ